jgi:hypothetical protein
MKREVYAIKKENFLVITKFAEQIFQSLLLREKTRKKEFEEIMLSDALRIYPLAIKLIIIETIIDTLGFFDDLRPYLDRVEVDYSKNEIEIKEVLKYAI